MIDLNIANFLTIGIISVGFFALLMWAMNMLGWSTNWLAGGANG